MTHHRAHARHRRRSTTRLWQLLMLPLGVFLLCLAGLPFFTFPVVGAWVLPLAAIYLFLLLVLPRMWLWVLPMATIGLDFTPWTGRFLYNEFDLLFLLTLASGLIYNRLRFSVFALTPAAMALLAYLLVLAVGYADWSAFFLPPQTTWQNPYYGDGYAYKVFKGVLWGVALVPMWGHLLAQDKRRATRALVGGLSLAAMLLGLVVLWERGTLSLILHGSAWYHIVNSLLDLGSSYRVTGLFSDMHTGGEVLDGVLLLLLPASLHAIVHGDRLWLRLLGVIALMILAYVALVGFTRATYVAFALGILCYAAMQLWHRRLAGEQSALDLPWLLLTLTCATLAALVAYRFAGSYGLASFSGLVLLGYAGYRFAPGRRVVLTLGALALLLVALAVNAHFSSRWVAPSLLHAGLVALLLLPVLPIAYGLFRRSAALAEFDRLLVLGACLFGPVLVAFALGGYQINDRMTRVDSDLNTRQQHWQDVAGSSASGFWSHLLGNGVGSFPSRYIGAHPGKVSVVGSYSVEPGPRGFLLRLGGGRDMTIGQRVGIEPFTDYTFSLRFRSRRAGWLEVALCERNVLYASNFMPHCERARVRLEPGDEAFHDASVQINSSRIGARGSLHRWPTLLSLRFTGAGQVIDIDNLRLSADGFNLLRNSSFNSGLDNWFSYDDFAHLPWHVKNLFLQVWFESGWLGLGLFVGLLGLLVRQSLQRHARDSLAPVYVTGVLTVVAFGFFGSPLDSPRASWLFHFYLVAGVATLRQGALPDLQARASTLFAAARGG